MNTSALQQTLSEVGRWRAQYGGTAMNPLIRDRIDSYETSGADRDVFIPATKSKIQADEDGCVICMTEQFENEIDVVRPVSCQHLFHRECLKRWSLEKMECPTCRVQFRIQLGFQPIVKGSYFHITYNENPIHDFPRCGSQIITIFIPSARQTKEHPHPGRMFKGIYVVMYLPDNIEGKDIARMLHIAYRRRLLFRVEGHALVPNGVELKRYPDKHYFPRVRMDLQEMGIH
jgi:hypothetical protein